MKNVLPLIKKHGTKKKMSPGDTVHILYKPNVGLESYINGKLVCTNEGLDFKKAYFGMWLSETTAIPGLK